MTPADELRTAADKLRTLLADLRDCRGPWYVVNREQRPYPQRIDNIGVPYVVASTTTDPSHPPTMADYICAMHPGTGKALANWLESWTGIEMYEAHALPEDARHALAVARAINGSSTPTSAAPEPAPTDVEHCVHDRAIHQHHHLTPVDGCPWCAAAVEARS